MFRRLMFENWAIICTLIAFATALSIFLFIAYRALRMSRKDTARIANIPLEEEKRVLADRKDEAQAKNEGYTQAAKQSGNHAKPSGRDKSASKNSDKNSDKNTDKNAGE